MSSKRKSLPTKLSLTDGEDESNPNQVDSSNIIDINTPKLTINQSKLSAFEGHLNQHSHKTFTNGFAEQLEAQCSALLSAVAAGNQQKSSATSALLPVSGSSFEICHSNQTKRRPKAVENRNGQIKEEKDDDDDEQKDEENQRLNSFQLDTNNNNHNNEGHNTLFTSFQTANSLNVATAAANAAAAVGLLPSNSNCNNSTNMASQLMSLCAANGSTSGLQIGLNNSASNAINAANAAGTINSSSPHSNPPTPVTNGCSSSTSSSSPSLSQSHNSSVGGSGHGNNRRRKRPSLSSDEEEKRENSSSTASSSASLLQGLTGSGNPFMNCNSAAMLNAFGSAMSASGLGALSSSMLSQQCAMGANAGGLSGNDSNDVAALLRRQLLESQFASLLPGNDNANDTEKRLSDMIKQLQELREKLYSGPNSDANTCKNKGIDSEVSFLDFSIN